MNKNLLYALLFIPHFAQAGTGSARDEWFMSGVLIGFLCLILLLIYLVTFVKRRLKNRNRITDMQELPPEEQLHEQTQIPETEKD